MVAIVNRWTVTIMSLAVFIVRFKFGLTAVLT